MARAQALPASYTLTMGTVGDAYDNAMAESFFASLECELIDRRSKKTKTEARVAILLGLKLGITRSHKGIKQQFPINFEAWRISLPMSCSVGMPRHE